MEYWSVGLRSEENITHLYPMHYTKDRLSIGFPGICITPSLQKLDFTGATTRVVGRFIKKNPRHGTPWRGYCISEAPGL